MVREMALSQSSPTAYTHELFRVVTNVAAGAPELLLVATVAPIAAEPLVPLASAPPNPTTVMDDGTDCERVAVTVTPVRGTPAIARQISDVPSC